MSRNKRELMVGGWIAPKTEKVSQALEKVSQAPLKVLYYTSVETVSEDTLDIQDVIVWGEPQPNLFSNEKAEP